jgi:hypothetical protein
MTACATTHPERPDVACDKADPCFGYHANALVGVSWPGNPLPERPEPEKKNTNRKAKLAMIAERAK